MPATDSGCSQRPDPVQRALLLPLLLELLDEDCVGPEDDDVDTDSVVDGLLRVEQPRRDTGNQPLVNKGNNRQQTNATDLLIVVLLFLLLRAGASL